MLTLSSLSVTGLCGLRFLSVKLRKRHSRRKVVRAGLQRDGEFFFGLVLLFQTELAKADKIMRIRNLWTISRNSGASAGSRLIASTADILCSFIDKLLKDLLCTIGLATFL